MTLQDHLKDTNQTVADFAARIGEPENTIRKIVYRQRQPSLPLAVKITDATGGAVTAADMVVQAEAA